MIAQRAQRHPAPDTERETRHARSRLERALVSLGVDAVLAEQLFGDLDEAYRQDTARAGVGAARYRYLREILRSAPHLGWSALRDGGPRERARLAAGAAAIALLLSLVVTAAGMKKGPPARLLADVGHASDGIVVNSMLPVQLPMRAVDARGRGLRDADVRYRRMSGAPVDVSEKGVVTCAEHGDAVVRASVGSITTEVVVRCRPVRQITASSWMTLLAGDPPQDLLFTAVGVDGRPVTELRGALRVRDSTVATLSGSTIRPIAPGETEVVVQVGDQTASIRVLVHEQVRAFTALRSEQRLVYVPVNLARGDTLRWTLPMGVYWLKYLPSRQGEAPPTIIADIVCGPGDGLRAHRLLREEYAVYCPLHADGSVTLAHGLVGAPIVQGTLAVERVQER